MGQVFVDFTVENYLDGPLGRPARIVGMTRVLMDTGATHLCLPADVAAELGLEPAQDVWVETAAGIVLRRLVQGARIRFEDRSATVDCIELPAGAQPLFGAIPMELLGIEPDLQTRSVRRLSRGPDRSYLMA